MFLFYFCYLFAFEIRKQITIFTLLTQSTNCFRREKEKYEKNVYIKKKRTSEHFYAFVYLTITPSRSSPYLQQKSEKRTKATVFFSSSPIQTRFSWVWISICYASIFVPFIHSFHSQFSASVKYWKSNFQIPDALSSFSSFSERKNAKRTHTN